MFIKDIAFNIFRNKREEVKNLNSTKSEFQMF